jgi:small-conductance mechanosensitive channel
MFDDVDTPMRTTLAEINISDLFHQVWYMELYKSGDYTVQLNQLIISLCIVLAGIIVSKSIARTLAGRVRRYSKVDDSLINLVEKFSFYLMTVLVVLVALPMAGIPITVFTVIGGALAIGVGFGAQNLFNNLICGILIVAERSVRVGDIVEMEGQDVRIEELGNRCIRVRRSDGVDMLVPNSFFLDRVVTNWTLFDSNVRGRVNVGVAYGSDAKLVRNLLMEVALEHPQVHKDMPPIVLFTDFGDNSLGFQLLYWTSVERPMDLRRIESDLRFRIDEVFKAHSICIAFPQRDVHLDTLRPLDVRVIPPDKP